MVPGEQSAFNSPSGIPLDAAVGGGAGVYVAEAGSHVIRYTQLSNGATSTVAGSPGVSGWGDSPSQIRFNAPTDLASSPFTGRLYCADRGNNRLRGISLLAGYPGTPTLIWTVAGSGAAGWVEGSGQSAAFNSPISVALDTAASRSSGVGDVLYVGDSTNLRIRVVTVPPGGGGGGGCRFHSLWRRYRGVG